LQILTGAGHHVYADRADIFNRHVNDACKLADGGETRKKLSPQTKLSSPSEELEEETSNTESEENVSATNRSNRKLRSVSRQKSSS
jgi:abhydrolase domain-containing protein 5